MKVEGAITFCPEHPRYATVANRVSLNNNSKETQDSICSQMHTNREASFSVLEVAVTSSDVSRNHCWPRTTVAQAAPKRSQSAVVDDAAVAAAR